MLTEQPVQPEAVEPGFGPDTAASVEVLNLLGEKYLQLAPEGAGQMSAGSTMVAPALRRMAMACSTGPPGTVWMMAKLIRITPTKVGTKKKPKMMIRTEASGLPSVRRSSVPTALWAVPVTESAALDAVPVIDPPADAMPCLVPSALPITLSRTERKRLFVASLRRSMIWLGLILSVRASRSRDRSSRVPSMFLVSCSSVPWPIARPP